MKQQQPTEFVWKNSCLLIKNPNSAILTYLSYVKRTLDIRTGPKSEKENLYEKVGDDVVVTMQGFLQPCIEICKKKDIKYTVKDKRLFFPFPQIDKIQGLRGSQFPVLMQFLLKAQSGILKMPTRYGKSWLMLNILRAFPGLPTVVCMPGIDLVKQTATTYRKMLPGREVATIATGLGSTPCDDITVCSFESLDKVDKANTKLVLIDEVHSAVSESRGPTFSEFPNARIMGFTATATGRFDNADKLMIGLVGPILVEKTFTEAVAEGMICPITVYMIHTYLDATKYKRYNAIYDAVAYKNEKIQRLVADICNDYIPEDWQTLTIIANKAQAYSLSKKVDSSEVAIAGDMSDKERASMFDRMQASEVQRCIATGIYSQGVTFSNLRVMINYAGGSKNISSIQKPGRLAEVVEGKKCGYMVDFLFDIREDSEKSDNRWPVVRDARNRKELYEDIGYDVVVVEENDLEQLIFD